ncbi:hypothetical protein J6590_046815 [Homalodisca vitripennis]|nr:hypothetical protein J6590_046815 [Homalodisca vitripennis]
MGAISNDWFIIERPRTPSSTGEEHSLSYCQHAGHMLEKGERNFRVRLAQCIDNNGRHLSNIKEPNCEEAPPIKFLWVSPFRVVIEAASFVPEFHTYLLLLEGGI